METSLTTPYQQLPRDGELRKPRRIFISLSSIFMVIFFSSPPGSLPPSVFASIAQEGKAAEAAPELVYLARQKIFLQLSSLCHFRAIARKYNRGCVI